MLGHDRVSGHATLACTGGELERDAAPQCLRVQLSDDDQQRARGVRARVEALAIEQLAKLARVGFFAGQLEHVGSCQAARLQACGDRAHARAVEPRRERGGCEEHRHSAGRERGGWASEDVGSRAGAVRGHDGASLAPRWLPRRLKAC